VANHKSMGETFQELREVLVGYAKQETVEPLDKLKHYLGFGIPGALFVSLGVFLVGLGLLQLVEHWAPTTTGFGSLAPYVVSSMFLFVVLVVCAVKARRSMSEGDDRRGGSRR